MILNPTLWARALLIVAMLALLPLGCMYRVGEPATGEWCTFDSPHRIPMIGVARGDTLWVDVLIKATIPCDSLPPGVEHRRK